MHRKFLMKLVETLKAVLPISILVIILGLTPLVDTTPREIGIFAIMSVVLILGITLFNLGAEIAMSQMGEKLGSSLIKTKNLKIIILVILTLGILITIAEPDLKVLANQVKEAINGWVLIVSIGVGVGLFLVIAVLKIFFKFNLTQLLLFFYLGAFALAALVASTGNTSFLPLAFDSGGVTTGPITVPFIMALGLGIAQTVGGRDASENSFGLIALCSIGPIIVIMLLSLIYGSGNVDFNTSYEMSNNIVKDFFMTFLETSGTVALSLFLILAFFMAIDLIYLHLPMKKLLSIFIGIFDTFIGLALFLTAVEIGYMPIGYILGTELASKKILLIIFAFIIGFVVVLAEPAIHVLTHQVEEVTNGGVTRKQMLLALSIGVGVAIMSAVLRVVFDFPLLYIIIPGYLISLGLSFFVPKLYTAIAFDSGGVASGPLTSSFVLPMIIGACQMLQGPSKILSDAFGVVALVAMIPLITIQALGFKAVVQKRVKEKHFIKKIISEDDEQIIKFR